MRFNFLLLIVCLAATVGMAQNSAPQPQLIDDFAVTGNRSPALTPVTYANHAAGAETFAAPNYGDATVAAAARAQARRAFELINRERAAHGLSPLQWDASAARMAESYALDMAQRNFFNHVDPDGRDPAARARLTGVSGWRALGENIAVNRGYENPVAQAVENWLKSQKHRDNILQPYFTHAAIGVAVDHNGRYYFTQVFLTRR